MTRGTEKSGGGKRMITSDMSFSLIFLTREHLCVLLDTTTKNAYQDDIKDFRSDYSPFNNLFVKYVS